MRYLWYEQVYSRALDEACAASDALAVNPADPETYASLQVSLPIIHLIEVLDSTVSPMVARRALNGAVAHLDIALASISDKEAS